MNKVTPKEPGPVTGYELPVLLVSRQLGGRKPEYGCLCLKCFNRQLVCQCNYDYQVLAIHGLPYKCDLCSNKSPKDIGDLYGEYVGVQALVIHRTKGGSTHNLCMRCVERAYWDESKIIILPLQSLPNACQCDFCHGSRQKRLL